MELDDTREGQDMKSLRKYKAMLHADSQALDALMLSVGDRELTEEEARRKFRLERAIEETIQAVFYLQQSQLSSVD